MKFVGSIVLSIFVSLQVFASKKPPKNVIGMEKAKQIATQSVPGTIKDSELEFEHNQWVYSFDITGSDQKIHEVLVNAKNGKIISKKVESSAEEAAEKKAEESQSK